MQVQCPAGIFNEPEQDVQIFNAAKPGRNGINNVITHIYKAVDQVIQQLPGMGKNKKRY
jgi:hypothetical protein